MNKEVFIKGIDKLVDRWLRDQLPEGTERQMIEDTIAILYAELKHIDIAIMNLN